MILINPVSCRCRTASLGLQSLLAFAGTFRKTFPLYMSLSLVRSRRQLCLDLRFMFSSVYCLSRAISPTWKPRI